MMDASRNCRGAYRGFRSDRRFAAMLAFNAVLARS